MSNRIRVGVDTNVLCAGVRARWGAPKGVLALAAASGLNISTSGDFLRRLSVPQARPGNS